MNFASSLRAPFLQNTSWRLLLKSFSHSAIIDITIYQSIFYILVYINTRYSYIYYYISVIHISTLYKYYSKNCKITKTDETSNNGYLYTLNIFCWDQCLIYFVRINTLNHSLTGCAITIKATNYILRSSD